MKKNVQYADFLLSLVIATVDRTKELRKLLQTLTESTDKNFEVIVADQNEDNRVEEIITEFELHLNITHIKILRKNACEARNMGAALATGTWLGFPDDDCFYAPHTIATIKKTICTSGSQLISGTILDFKGKPLNRQFVSHCNISFLNLCGKVPEPSLFIEKNTFFNLEGFNEAFGPGGKYFSSEGYELVLRALERKKKVSFDASIQIIHPRKQPPFDEKTVLKGYYYSYGFGAVMARHYGLWAFLYMLKYMTAFAVKMIIHRGLHRSFSISSCRGLIDGFSHSAIRPAWRKEKTRNEIIPRFENS